MAHSAPRTALVIGGGVAGTSIARFLARRGVGVTVLEKAGQLCAGATWHAAGLVTRFGGSPKIKKVHVRALDLMTRMHEEHEGGVGLHLTGSIRIIEKGDHDRLLEAKQHVAMARLYDDPALPTTMISAAEVAALHPLVDASRVECGVFTPKDGDVDPTMLTTAISRDAKADGAAFRFGTEVQEVKALGGGGFEVHVATEGGGEEVLRADAVVNAAGLWSRRFSNQLGMEHPAFVIEHQYAITEALPQLEGRLGDGQRVPVLRDLAGSSYVRQERDGLLVGPYEEGTRVHTEWAEGPPRNFAFDLFPPALDRIEDCLAHAMELIPALQTVGLRSIVNGPTIWTGDSLARCGRTRLPGYYDFNSLTYGVAQGLALAEYLAHIIVEGEQPHDMATEFDPLRYGGWASDAYAERKIGETYSFNNAVSYPHENRPAGRDAVPHPPGRAALLGELRQRGALCSFSNSGVEVPIVFGAPGAPPPPPDFYRTFHHHPWAATADEEAAHLLRGVGLGFSSFSKLAISGDADAAATLLHHCTTNTLPKRPGRCRLTYATTAAGKILAEFTVTRGGFEHGALAAAGAQYYLVGPRDYAQHDLAWLEQQSAALTRAGDVGEGALQLSNLTDEIEILHVAGAKAADLMAEICPDAADVPFLQMREMQVCGVAAQVFRISFTGEAGYELHVRTDDAAPLWRAIWAHPASAEYGLMPFGGQAVNALRIEKAFRIKSDLDYAHWTEAGIEPFVALKRDGTRFLGRDAPPPSPADGSARRHAVFTVQTSEGHAWSVPGDSPVIDADDQVVGFTTTSARGAVTGQTVALGYVKLAADGAPRAVPGAAGLRVQCYGEAWPVELLERPPIAVGKPAPAKPEPVAAVG